jgi:hypothetical protein
MKLFLLLLPALLAGCVSSQRIVTGTARPALTSAAVRIYRAMPEGAEEIGIVNAEASGNNQAAMNTALAEIKRQAAALGANGFTVIGSGNRTESSGGFGSVVPVGGVGLGLFNDTHSHKTIVKARVFYYAPMIQSVGP